MISHRYVLLLLTGLLSVPATALRAEQISSVSAFTSQSVAAAIAEESAASSGAPASFEFSAIAPSATDVEISPAVLADDSAGTQANFTPVGLMVAASTVASVPEPSTVVLLSCGALGIFLAARKRRG